MVSKLLSLFFIFYFYFIYIIVKVLTILAPIVKPRGKKSGVLYLELFGPPSAGYRFRSSAWAGILSNNGIKARVKYLISYEEYKKLSKTPLGNIRFHFYVLTKRFWQCVNSGSYETVVVRRELLMYNDYGNLFFEKWMRKYHYHLILDVDDDLAAAKHEPRTIGLFGKLLQESPIKFKRSLNYYDGFICGSDYLLRQIKSYNPLVATKKTIVVPTCVYYSTLLVKSYPPTQAPVMTFGWVGASYNLSNLALVIPYLERLSKEYPLRLVVICDEPLKTSASFEIENIQWSEQKEAKNLVRINIGLMPLTDDMENMGKSGLKLIQYMGSGIVSVASAYAVNKVIVENEVNGFLVYKEEDWYEVLKKVIQSRPNFKAIGINGRKAIIDKYSFSSNSDQYLNFIRNIVTQNTD